MNLESPSNLVINSPELVYELQQTTQALGLAALQILNLQDIPPANLAAMQQDFNEWLRRGEHGDMLYLQRLKERTNLEPIMEETQSLLIVALAYPPPEKTPAEVEPREQSIAAYALSQDYHLLLKHQLNLLVSRLQELLTAKHPEYPLKTRVCVDTAPLNERFFAQAAGLGFIGKSRMLIIPKLGSYFLLGEILTNLSFTKTALAPLESTRIPATFSCGKCTRCLTACPTAALKPIGNLDARKCLSYLTIENKQTMPETFRKALGNKIFGCDICQEVCPFNQGSKLTNLLTYPARAPNLQELRTLSLSALLQLTPAAYRRYTHATALTRLNFKQFKRNVLIALSNQPAYHRPEIGELLTYLHDKETTPWLKELLSEIKALLESKY